MKKTLPLIRLELFHELGKSLAIDRNIFLDDNLDDDRTLTSYAQDGEAALHVGGVLAHPAPGFSSNGASGRGGHAQLYPAVQGRKGDIPVHRASGSEGM